MNKIQQSKKFTIIDKERILKFLEFDKYKDIINWLKVANLELEAIKIAKKKS